MVSLAGISHRSDSTSHRKNASSTFIVGITSDARPKTHADSSFKAIFPRGGERQRGPYLRARGLFCGLLPITNVEEPKAATASRIMCEEIAHIHFRFGLTKLAQNLLSHFLVLILSV